MVLFKTSAGLQEVFSWNASLVYYVISVPLYVLFCDLWRCVFAVSTAGFQYMRLCTGPDHAGFIGGPLPRVFHPGPSFAPRCSIGQRFYVGIKGCENK